MSASDDDQFRPKPGRIRSTVQGDRGTQSFFIKVRKIALQQGVAGAGKAFSLAHSQRHPGDATSHGRGKGVKRGRGAAFVRARGLDGGWSHRQPGTRRVIVKARLVIGAGKNGRGTAHLRYVQRDGTARSGERGQLYSAAADRADEAGFLDRGKDDRHQFRFIVAPEDAAEISDLTGFTRDLMSQVEQDLGTKLDWVAVNHHNTGHPHVHVIVNGRDDQGQDLIINGDYIANGIRERASELVTLELGPMTEIEQRQKLTAEIDQDRFTRVDRAMIMEANGRELDLRQHPSDQRGGADRTLRLARLNKLERMGLAVEEEPGRWKLSGRLEPVLRELGERGDIIKSINRTLQAEGEERDSANFQKHEGPPSAPIIGRILDKHLTDELGENLTLIVDGIDGRVHHVSGIEPEQLDDAKIGSIIEIDRCEPAERPADRTIAAVAEDGVYRPSRHLEELRFHGRGPVGDHAGFVEAHVRRLEALRWVGTVERIDEDRWRIPEDFERRAAAYEAARNRQLTVRTLSILDLERQIEANGATWLDRRLVGQGSSDVVDAGFGSKVQDALERRREHLIEQGDASLASDGRISYRRNLLSILQDREISTVGAKTALSLSVPFRAAADGESVQGTFKQTLHLSSGKFAVIENAQELTLVPWRPVLDQHIGQEVRGIVQGQTISWQFGKKLGIGL